MQHLVLPGARLSNNSPGPALLNFSDRADTDELTPYSVHNMNYRLVNEWWLRPFLWTSRLNWARRTSWWLWDTKGRHIFWNSSPGGLMASTQLRYLSVTRLDLYEWGEKNHSLHIMQALAWHALGIATTPGPLPYKWYRSRNIYGFKIW